jgi:hypothetical protein
MTDDWKVYCAGYVYNFCLIALSTYYVAVYDWSTWWIFAAFLCMVNMRPKSE